MFVRGPRSIAPRWAGLACAVSLAVLPACRSRPAGQRAVQELGTFTAEVDPRAGTVALRLLPRATLAGPGQAALEAGAPVELTTEWTGAVSRDGTVTGHDCGRRGTICTAVTVRSLAASELHDVYVELVDRSPALGVLAAGSTAAPTGGEDGAGQVSARYGLWRYPALLDQARGGTSGPTLGANAATRTWIFDAQSQEPFRLQGRVMATVVPVAPAAAGLQASCGGVATDLATTADCGECGRRAPDASACVYAGGGAVLDFQVTCSAGRTACDTGDADAFACLDLQSDPESCGACGHSCGALPCTAGACGARCAAGESACTVGGVPMCCPAGSSCSAGACVLTDATEVAVGRDHACAATTTARPAPAWAEVPAPTTSNNVVCWGAGWFGPLSASRAMAVPEYLPVPADGSSTPYQLRADMWRLSSGDEETVGFSRGYADAFGHTNPFHWGAVRNYVDGWLSEATQVTAGGHHGCGMWPDGVYCWGSNALGQLGVNSDLPECPGRMACFVADLDGASPADLSLGLLAEELAAGGDSTCAVLQAARPTGKGAGQVEGGVACWGDDTDGKSGGPAAGFLAFPHLVPGVANASAVSVGGRHAVAVVDGGSALVFWGRNAEGEFGDGTQASVPGTAVRVTPAAPVASVSAGQDFTCYVAGGRVYCAGRNDRGQLGDGTTVGRSTFAPVPGVYGATAVSAGGVPGSPGAPLGSVCALAAGQVLCWGDDSAGQLGTGAPEPWTAVPRNVLLQPSPPLP